jgi:hypothetical protein
MRFPSLHNTLIVFHCFAQDALRAPGFLFVRG